MAPLIGAKQQTGLVTALRILKLSERFGTSKSQMPTLLGDFLDQCYATVRATWPSGPLLPSSLDFMEIGFFDRTGLLFAGIATPGGRSGLRTRLRRPMWAAGKVFVCFQVIA
jgi:hypothetical protein